MPLGPDPELARTAVARLDALRAAVTAAEDDVLACLVVTGEPRPQRVLDDWLDQAADTLRALGEQAADLSPTLSRHTGPAGALGSGPDAASTGSLAASDACPLGAASDAGFLGAVPDAGSLATAPDAGSAGSTAAARDAVAGFATSLGTQERP